MNVRCMAGSALSQNISDKIVTKCFKNFTRISALLSTRITIKK